MSAKAPNLCKFKNCKQPRLYAMSIGIDDYCWKHRRQLTLSPDAIQLAEKPWDISKIKGTWQRDGKVKPWWKFWGQQ